MRVIDYVRALAVSEFFDENMKRIHVDPDLFEGEFIYLPETDFITCPRILIGDGLPFRLRPNTPIDGMFKSIFTGVDVDITHPITFSRVDDDYEFVLKSIVLELEETERTDVVVDFYKDLKISKILIETKYEDDCDKEFYISSTSRVDITDLASTCGSISIWVGANVAFDSFTNKKMSKKRPTAYITNNGSRCYNPSFMNEGADVFDLRVLEFDVDIEAKGLRRSNPPTAYSCVFERCRVGADFSGTYIARDLYVDCDIDIGADVTIDTVSWTESVFRSCRFRSVAGRWHLRIIRRKFSNCVLTGFAEVALEKFQHDVDSVVDYRCQFKDIDRLASNYDSILMESTLHDVKELAQICLFRCELSGEDVCCDSVYIHPDDRRKVGLDLIDEQQYSNVLAEHVGDEIRIDSKWSADAIMKKSMALANIVDLLNLLDVENNDSFKGFVNELS